MKFKELAEYFEKLEQTQSRLALIAILAELFSITPEAEIEKIVYLTQGRLAPFFVPIEMGMAEKTVAQAIANAYGLTKEEVLKLYQKLGDMGLVAQELAEVACKNHCLVSKNPALARGNFLVHNAKQTQSVKKTINSVSVASENFASSPYFQSPLQSASVTLRKEQLSVSEVFRLLTQIANTNGEGTVEKRQTILAELLQQLDPLAVKHLVRIPLGNTRLGIGDPTVLDALATAKLGDKSKRKLLEGAYNRTSDLGLIAKTLWSGGLPAVEKLKIIVGKPIRSELCERLPTPEKVIEKMVEVDVQYKYDGFRTQLHKNGEQVMIFSRNLENMSSMFPELVRAVLEQVQAKTAIFDAEALAYNPASEEFLPFQETTKRRRKHGIAEMAAKLPLKAFVFDLLYKDGISYLDKPLTTRLEVLQKTIQADDILIPAKNEVIKDPKRLQLLLDEAISKGLEGLVVKRLGSSYEAGGRNFNWVKLKRHSSGELNDTIDCVILGYISGKGKRTAFGAGALLVGVYDSKQDDFVTVSKIGTGLTDEEWQSIKQRAKGLERSVKPARINSLITPSVWVEPKIVIEVLADEITRSPIHTAGTKFNQELKEPGYALRFPRLVSFRDKDKKAEDATTVKELIEMYQQQGKK